MLKNWNKLVTIQEAAAAYAAGDDLGAYCFLYAGDRVRTYRETVSGDIITLPPYDPPLTLYTKTGRFIDSLIANIEPGQAGTGDPSPDNIRPISGWTGVNVTVSPTLDAEDGQTYNITFPSEAGIVYGGQLDVTTGVLTVTMAEVDLGTLTWNRTTSYSAPLFYTNIATKKASNISMRCSAYKYSGNFSSAVGFANFSENASIGNCNANMQIFVRDDSYTDIATFKTAMQGVQLVYELATPQTYQLTPTEVTLLLGENNIFADTGPITLTYVETREVSNE